MARAAKKEKVLTLEEKLQQALVPMTEQPYKVPENWCWTRVGSLCSFIGGGTPSKTNPKYWGGSIPWASVKDIKGEYLYETIDHITQDGVENSASNICDEGDLLLVTRIEPAKTIVSKISTAINQDLKIVKSDLPSVFLNYYFKTFRHEFEIKSSGSTVKGITIPNVENTPFPLPPLAEQHRIVSRIESLFVKLDEAKEKAQAVVDGFEDRKSAILHMAFTGKLTAKWRDKRGLPLSSWSTKSIGSFSFVTKLAGFEYTKNIAPNLVEKGIPLFKGKNVQEGKLVLNFESFIPKEVSDELPRSKLTRKCLLTPYVGTIGNIAIFDGSFEAHLGSNVGKIEVNSDTFEEYLLYYLRSDLGYKELTKEKKATAQESISIQAIRNVIVPIPTITEQYEIVRSLNNLIVKGEQAKNAAEQFISQIDTMKKSILARAFRGELGTNDPTDESAEELLKRIL